MSAAAASSTRLVALDSWRGICAVLVVLYHTNVLSHLYGLSLVRQSWLWVDFFFVLSGFVVSHAYYQKLGSLSERASFLTKRLSRLWPLHVFVLSVMILVQIGLLVPAIFGHVGFKTAPFTGPYDPLRLLPHLLLIQALPGIGAGGWNGPAWSISVEFWTYMTFLMPLSINAVRQRIAFGLAISAMSAAIIVWFSTHYLEAPSDLDLIRCFYGFGIGYLCHALWRAGWTQMLRGTAMEVAVLATSVVLVMRSGDTAWTLLLPPAFALVVSTYAAGAGRISGVLAARPFVFLGEISFSVYLIHFTIIDLCSRGVGLAEKVTHATLWTPVVTPNGEHVQALDLSSPWLGDLGMVMVLTIVILLATVTFRLVEKPNLALFRIPARFRVVEKDRLAFGNEPTSI